MAVIPIEIAIITFKSISVFHHTGISRADAVVTLFFDFLFIAAGIKPINIAGIARVAGVRSRNAFIPHTTDIVVGVLTAVVHMTEAEGHEPCGDGNILGG